MATDDPDPSTDDPGEERGLTRRRLLGLGAAAVGAAAAGAVVGPGTADAAAPKAASYPVAPARTTIARTLLHGQPDSAGYRPIVVGPGEPTILRADLQDGAARTATATRRPMLAFIQFTDMHLVDAQSPARVEFLDRFNDPDDALSAVAPFSAAYRPWEMLNVQVAEAMVRAANALPGGPITGRRVDFTICTGDNSDNLQYNEIRWHVDVLDGHKSVRPDSGDRSRWEGVGGPSDHDSAYWHPAGSPPLDRPDNYRSKHGYPIVPALLDACRAPFTATGLRTPWYAVMGNHDGLAAGNVPSDPVLQAIATGPVKPTGVPDGIDVRQVVAAAKSGDVAALETLFTAGPAKLVTPDPDRRMLDLTQMVKEYFVTTGTPVGHGYTQQNLANGTAYYSFTRERVHCISLDTVNRNGYDDGSLDAEQFAWLQAELEANSSRHLDPSGQWVRGTGRDNVILIFSHHTVATMDNVLGAGRVDGTTVANLLLQYPNVIGWINGHTHVNSIGPHARAAGSAVGGGFWEINTAAHVDWPQQSRVLEIVDNGDQTMSIFATIFDHAAPTSWPKNPTGPLQLAALSRELAVNDPQRDPETSARDGKRGTASDRNVELVVRRPF